MRPCPAWPTLLAAWILIRCIHSATKGQPSKPQRPSALMNRCVQLLQQQVLRCLVCKRTPLSAPKTTASLKWAEHSPLRSALCCRFIPSLPWSLGFPCGSAGKESARNVGDLGSIPGLGRSPGEGNGHPLQCSGLENPVDCIVCGVAKSWTRLSDLHFHWSQREEDSVRLDPGPWTQSQRA